MIKHSPYISELKPDQLKAYYNIMYHIEESVFKTDIFRENGLISLHGPGGSGKTFLTKSIVHTLELSKLKTIVLAPTHKALTVLKQHITADVDFKTIHSYLGLKLYTDFNTGLQTFKPVKNQDDKKEYDVIIIDESSLLQDELIGYLDREIIEKGLTKCVLFTGDKLQLLPVGSNTISKVFLNPVINQYELTEVIRNGNTEVLDFFTEIRKLIQDNKSKNDLFNLIKEYSNRNLEKIFFFKDSKEFLTKYLEKEKRNTDDEVIITYTNESVNIYNNFCRMRYVNSKEKITKNEIIICNDNVYEIKLTKKGTRIQGKILYNNSEQIKIKVINDSSMNILGSIINFYDVTCYKGNNFKILKDESIKEYNKVLEEYKQSNKWEKYYNFKEEFLDYRYMYSLTCHKSQGSTYDNVWIDFRGLNYLSDSDYLRLFYVGCSRSKNEVNILI